MNEGESVLEGFFPPKPKKKFRVLPSEKLTLNAKRVNSPAHSSPSPLNFATVLQDLWPTGGRALSYCEELHLQKHSELGLMNIYTLIRRPDLSGCDRKGMMGLKELRQERRQRYGSVNADPPLHITGRPLETTGGCVESFQLRLWEVFGRCQSHVR